MPGPTNYFDLDNLSTLPADVADLVSRRRDTMGAAYRLFYSDPVEIVRGSGSYLYDQHDNRYLDAYNNVPTAGHCHPRVVEAISKQVAELNTHTRYLHPAIIRYSEQILATFPAGLDNIMYTCTGSEANDLALRIAKFISGGTGVIVTTEAYHGITTETAAISPSLGGTESIPDWVRLVAAPDSYRGDGAFAAGVAEAVADMEAHGIRPAAIIFDSVFASDGVLTPDPAEIRAAVQTVRDAGGLCIADEVQSGFGRLGTSLWGFETFGLEPDIVTIGKPMGSGQPIAAMIARSEFIDRFGNYARYFSTFAGNPVSIAAAQATLDVVREENLVERTADTGRYLRQLVLDLGQQQPVIGDVRGSGLFLGIDLISDPRTRQPAGDYAFDIVNAMRADRVLAAAVGPGRNVLKIRPPLSFDRTAADRFVDSLAHAIRVVPSPNASPPQTV